MLKCSCILWGTPTLEFLAENTDNFGGLCKTEKHQLCHRAGMCIRAFKPDAVGIEAAKVQYMKCEQIIIDLSRPKK